MSDPEILEHNVASPSPERATDEAQESDKHAQPLGDREPTKASRDPERQADAKYEQPDPDREEASPLVRIERRLTTCKLLPRDRGASQRRPTRIGQHSFCLIDLDIPSNILYRCSVKPPSAILLST